MVEPALEVEARLDTADELPLTPGVVQTWSLPSESFSASLLLSSRFLSSASLLDVVHFDDPLALPAVELVEALLAADEPSFGEQPGGTMTTLDGVRSDMPVSPVRNDEVGASSGEQAAIEAPTTRTVVRATYLRVLIEIMACAGLEGRLEAAPNVMHQGSPHK